MKIIKVLMLILVTLNSYSFANSTIKEKNSNLNFAVASNSGLLTKFKDANVAISAWLEDMGGIYGSKTTVEFYENTEALASDFILKKQDVILIDLPYFFRHRSNLEKYVDVKWSLSIGDDKYNEYYFIANKSKKIKSFKDIKNKVISLKKEDPVAINWLEKKSYIDNKKSYSKLLKKLDKVKNDRRLVLNVFFGKSDGGIITKNAWETMLELNPSIKSKVEVIAKSKKIFIPFIGLYSKWGDKSVQELFFENSKDLQKMQGGDLVISIMKFNSVYKIEQKVIDELDNYFNEYFTLEKKYR